MLVNLRKYGSKVDGKTFDSNIVSIVWEKGRKITGYDPNKYRKDACGAWISKNDYGNTNSNFGWEIDHIIPVAKKGSDDISNLQPLHWQNNRGKSDDWPNWQCSISATK